MKKYLMILILSGVLGSVAFSQGTWELLHPPGPTTNQLVSLHFIDQSNGWAVGEYGTILKTTDAGYNWRLIEIPQLNYLTDVFFPSPSVGYATGKDGLIIKSIDGGESWFSQTIRFTNNLHRVRFRDENNGWVIGEKGLILHTNDGGVNWEQQVSNSREHLYGIALVPDTTSAVFVVGADSTILVTYDEGENWQRKLFKPKNPKMTYFSFKDIYFLNESFGWIGGMGGSHGILVFTMNGGNTWWEFQVLENEYDSWYSGSHSGGGIMPVQQIYFSHRRHGIYLTDLDFNGMANLLLQTTTSGNRWSGFVIGSMESFEGDGRFAYLSENRIINTGYRGEFRISSDNGATWEFPNHLTRNFLDIRVLNLGYLNGIIEIEKGIYTWTRSDNYGKKWRGYIPRFYDRHGNLQNDISYYRLGNFTDAGKTLRTITDYNYHVDTCSVYESHDYGVSWHLVHNQASKIFNNPYFLSADTLIQYDLHNREISPGKRKAELEFRYSFDGGRTPHIEFFQNLWSQSSESYPFISKHYFFNGHTGFIIGSNGNIIKTTDTGRSWENVHSGVVENLWDITFVNCQTGFVVGEFGRILKTEDGGQTWRKTDSGTQEDVYSIGFKNETEGWAGTETGLRYTRDGGETWQGVPLRYFHGPVWEIEFDNDGTGYAFTYETSYRADEWYTRPDGYFLLMVLKEGGVIIENTPATAPYQFALSQNYPNPFNSTTHIRFSLPENEPVSLKIYNIQGQLVRTLLDEVRKPGEHAVVWDGTTNSGQLVASGVYFYRLTRNGEIRVRKLLVLK